MGSVCSTRKKDNLDYQINKKLNKIIPVIQQSHQ